MSLQFDKLVKRIVFDDRDTCIAESERLIKDPRFNQDKPALTIITLKTRKELREHLYPRVEEFHKLRSSKRYQLASDNIYRSTPEIFSNKVLPVYHSTDKVATYNTIEYVFEQFRRGVFVQILNNKIKTFVAIDNYESEGFDLMRHIKFDPAKYKNMDEFITRADKELFKHFNVHKRKEDAIYFTNCSVNLWTSDTRAKEEVEVDWIYSYQYHIISELLKVKKINDIEFFLNFKDQTMLMKDGESSPHYHILGNYTTPLKRKSKQFIPILNLSTHTKFADIPLPTSDDWEIITNKIFLGTCRDSYFNVMNHVNQNYDSKIPTAIFRGGATGCGTIIKNNPRLRAAYLSSKYYHHEKYGIKSKNGLYLDARLVSFKVRPKKHYSEKYLTIINPKTLPIKLSKKMSLGDITNYKYVVSIEGNVAQFRLSLELAYNSVILLVKSDYRVWFQPLMKPWVHYVPVKSDLSDLMDKIHWCKTNDDKCKVIAANAVKLYNKYINEPSVYDYMEGVMNQW